MRISCDHNDLFSKRWNEYLYVCFVAIQTHYAVLEALALGEDEMPEVKDETWPDEAGLSR